MFVVEIRR